MDMLPKNEYTEFEDRQYVSPGLVVNETAEFIDNLRNTRNNNLQEIAQQTQTLGTDVPSSFGGLTGAGSYFTSRYATPQSSSLAQNLRTTAQAAALNQALANEQAMWKKRYNEAYRNYQKRSWDKQNDNGDKEDTTTEGGVDYEDPSDGSFIGEVPGVTDGYTTVMPDTDNGTVLRYDYVPYGGEGKTQYSYYPGQTSYVDAEVVRRERRGSDMTKSNSNRSGIVSVWRLPDGTSTNVDATYYTITQDAQGNYYAKDRSTGELTLIK